MQCIYKLSVCKKAQSVLCALPQLRKVLQRRTNDLLHTTLPRFWHVVLLSDWSLRPVNKSAAAIYNSQNILPYEHCRSSSPQISGKSSCNPCAAAVEVCRHHTIGLSAFLISSHSRPLLPKLPRQERMQPSSACHKGLHMLISITNLPAQVTHNCQTALQPCCDLLHHWFSAGFYGSPGARELSLRPLQGPQREQEQGWPPRGSAACS